MKRLQLMPLAIAMILFGSILLVAGAKGKNLVDVALGRTDTAPSLPGGTQADYADSGSSLGQSLAGAGDAITAAADRAGLATFDGHKIAHWILKYLVYGRAHGWTGHVTSGYRSFAEQTAIYNSGVRPAAKPGTSNHEGVYYPRGAVDVTDAQGLANALAHYPGGSLLVWAGAKDPVHFSHPHNGSY